MSPLFGAWAFAALAAAVLAHALIGAAGTFAGGEADAYDARAHVTVIPALVAALALLTAFAGWIAAGVAARRKRLDPVALIARCFVRVQPPVALAAVTCGATATLLAMEFAEQLLAAGRIEGVADALGGSPLLGALLVLAAATAVTLLGLRTAAGFAAAAAAITRVLLRALRCAPRCSIAACAHGMLAAPAPRRSLPLAGAHGVRGPPPAG
jgi:hypothetical protein